MNNVSDLELIPVLRSVTKRELFAKVFMFSKVVGKFEESLSHAIKPPTKKNSWSDCASGCCGSSCESILLQIAGFVKWGMYSESEQRKMELDESYVPAPLLASQMDYSESAGTFIFEESERVGDGESAKTLYDILRSNEELRDHELVDVDPIDVFVSLGLVAKNLCGFESRLIEALQCVVCCPPFDGTIEELMWGSLNFPLGEIPGGKTCIPFWESGDDWWMGEQDWVEADLRETALRLIQENSEWVERHGLDASGIGKLL